MGQLAARALGCHVLGYDPNLSREAMKDLCGLTKVQTFDAFVRMCDVMSFHAPLTRKTKHMLHQFDQVKDSGVTIVIASGSNVELLEPEATREALASHRIRGLAFSPTLEDDLDRMGEHPHVVHFQTCSSTRSVGFNLTFLWVYIRS